ncbi:MAG: DGQHR domain-containing protein [Hyphomicrobiales bacterium]|nr:DGQHR domain-containing protein [Hyphomicrobiales bacterium]
MTEHKKIILPALRGLMGDWVYYSCLMNLNELAGRVQFAKEIHKNKSLSDMIQRELKDNRGKQISEYLTNQSERLFNSLVVATYGGQPNWQPLSSVKEKRTKNLSQLTEAQIASAGFLTLQGTEKLFALDGQHRLAGMKKAIEDGLQQDPVDEVSVIFVSHKDTSEGLKRTRRLFTTLNKTAKPVSKGEIIALDEDDVVAITVRRLVESDEILSGERIAFVASNNISPSNRVCLTTIGNLYDILDILFLCITQDKLIKKKSDLRTFRPSDEKLKSYFDLSKEYFVQLGKHFEELKMFFAADDTEPIVRKYRGSHGGSAVFRPIGLKIFTEVITYLVKSQSMSLTEAIKVAAKLPRDIDKEPYANLMWNVSKKTISNSHNVTIRHLLLHMLGHYTDKMKKEDLLSRYRREIGNDGTKLPRKII